ncbi:MAG: PilC/PilY family type IV pilus protein [Pseudomonadota bacterium]
MQTLVLCISLALSGIAGVVHALPPTLDTDIFTGDEDDVIAGNVLANDTGNFNLVVTSYTAGIPGGTFDIDGAGALTFDPDSLEHFSGVINFTYDVTEEDPLCIPPTLPPFPPGCFGSSSGVLVILPVADMPIVTQGTAEGDEDDSSIDLELGLTEVDTDGSQTLEIFISGVPSGASLTEGAEVASGIWQLSPAQIDSVEYVPPADFNGVVNLSLDITVNDESVDETSAPVIDSQNAPTSSITVTVNGEEDEPEVVGSLTPVDVFEDAPNEIIDLSGLFTDPDLPADSLDLSAALDGGIDVFDSISVSGDQLTLDFAANLHGNASVLITATDLAGNTADYSLSVGVTSVNDSPTVIGSLGSIFVDEDNTIPAIDLTTVFEDVDVLTSGDVLSYDVVSDNPDLFETLGASGDSLNIVLAGDAFGTATIRVVARDQAGVTSSPVDFDITVDPVNDDPVAVRDVVSMVDEDSGVVVVDVLANDNPGDQPTTVISVSATVVGLHYTLNQVDDIESAINGTVAIVGNMVEFTPTENFWGTVEFDYTIEDVDGQQSTNTVEINIDPVNDRPLADPRIYTTGEDADLIVDVANGLLNGSYDIDPARVDIDGNILYPQDLSVVISSFPDPAQGAIISSTSDGAFIFRPASGFADDTATFTYQIFDNVELSEEGLVSIFVTPNPDVPTPPNPGEVSVLFNLSNTPLEQASSVEPNVLVSMDDSGSMDWTITMDPAGTFRIRNNGIATSDVVGRNYVYLWDLENNTYEIDSNSGRVLPSEESLPAGNDYAVWQARSSAFNRIYYNPTVRYEPWSGVDSSNNNFADADETAIRLDPRNTSLSLDITQDQTYTSTGVPEWDTDGGSSDIEVTGYYIPRYYTETGTLVEIRDISGATYAGGVERNDCAVTTACTYDEEIQNFANWFQYYRSREHVAKAAVGSVVADLQDIRVGYETIHRRVDEPIAEMNENAFEGEKKELLDAIYSVNSSNGTPLRRALDDAGRILSCNYTGRDCPALPAPEGICQQNFTLLFSDGFWNGDDPTLADNYDTDGLGIFDGGRYADTYSATLADVAMYYYENDLQTGLADGVPISIADINGVPDGTFDEDDTLHQHMKTYTIAFGVSGSIDVATAEATDPTGTIAWPDPTASNNAKIDDMLHAALNGRGRFLNAGDPQELQTAIETAFLEFTQAASSSSAATFNSTSLQDGTLLYRGFYDLRNRTGELTASEVSTDGVVSTTPTWAAAGLLDSTTPASRTIVSYDPSTNSGIAFQHASLTADQQLTLSDIQVNYLRGDRSNEDPGGSLRARPATNGLLGDIVNSSPVFVGEPRAINRDQAPYPTSDLYSAFKNSQYSRSPMVYVGANDGMLHAFDALTGQETFAFVPNAILDGTAPFHNKLDSFTSTFYLHNYYVDLSPRLNDTYTRITAGGSRDWRTTLVGGLGAGGKGYFALNVTDPATSFSSVPNAADVVLWEFTDEDDTYPLTSAGAPLGGSVGALTDPSGNPVKDLGFALSLPVVTMSNVETSGEQDWVAIFGNGPNSTAGVSTLFVLFLDRGLDGWGTGDFVKIPTDFGVPLPGEQLAGYPNGLGSPTAVDADLNGTVDYVYAGDRLGNLFRFDLTDDNPNNWTALRLFTATYDYGGGDVRLQPILSRPLVVKHPQQPGFLITFGTGSFITEDDGADDEIQSIYTIWDNLTAVNPVTALSDTKSQRLVQQVMTNEVEDQDAEVRTRRVLTNNPVNYAAGVSGIYGWYVDLDPVRASLTLSGVTNPDMTGNAPPAVQFPGEKAIRRFIFRDGVIVTTTVLPASDEISCFGAQPGAILVLDHLTGGDAIDPVIDFNRDGTIDQLDLVGGTSSGASGGLLFGWGQLGGSGPDGQLVDLSLLGGAGDTDFLFVSGGNDTTSYRIRGAEDDKTGRLSWVELEQ